MPGPMPTATTSSRANAAPVTATASPSVDDALVLIARNDGRIVERACGDPERFSPGLGDVSGKYLDAVWPATVAATLRSQIVQATRRRCVMRLTVHLEREDGDEDHDITILANGRERALLICRNLTDHKTLERQVHDLAFRDPLTTLPNRAAFLRQLGEAFSGARLTGSALTVMRARLRGMAHINHTYGRAVGSELVAAAGKRLREAFAPGGTLAARLPAHAAATLARTEGNEFALLIDGSASGPLLEDLGDAVLALMRPAFTIDGHELTPTVSIGVARFPEDAADTESLLAKAAVALNEARAGSGSRCIFFSSTAQVRSISRLDVAQELRWALENDQFSVRFQPCFDCESDTIVSAEGLLRWEHPLRGEVPLSEILPVAEMNDLSDRLADWTFENAYRAALAADPDGRWPISLNLFARQAFAPGLATRLIDIARHDDIDPARVRFEIHEGDYHRDVGAAEESVRRLCDAGFSVIVDDCGLGALSARSLIRTGISMVKLSTRLVERLPGDERARKICAALLALGDKIGLRVSATGVETESQYECLRELGCRYMQGFYLCPPIEVGELTERLAVQARA